MTSRAFVGFAVAVAVTGCMGKGTLDLDVYNESGRSVWFWLNATYEPEGSARLVFSKNLSVPAGGALGDQMHLRANGYYLVAVSLDNGTRASLEVNHDGYHWPSLDLRSDGVGFALAVA